MSEEITSTAVRPRDAHRRQHQQAAQQLHGIRIDAEQHQRLRHPRDAADRAGDARMAATEQRAADHRRRAAPSAAGAIILARLVGTLGPLLG